MAESLQFRKSIDIGSDQVLDNYCEPCFEVDENVKPVAGCCLDCDQDLCFACFSTHLRRKPFKNHKLVDKTTKPKKKLTTPQTKPHNVNEECVLHHEEKLQSYCHGHSQFCCQVCLKIDHQACKTDAISKLARKIQDSKELKDLTEKLNTLKKGFNDTLNKTGANETVIQKRYHDAIDQMMKLKAEFDKLMAETEAQAEKIKEEDINKIENVFATCGIVIEQINKLTTNLDTLKGKGEMESLFIAMKRAESQLKSLEENLDKLKKDNTVREYTFEPDEKLEALLKELKVLGKLSFQNSQKQASITDQIAKQPFHVKDIPIKLPTEKKSDITGILMLQNIYNHILVSDWENKKLKLIDTNQDKIISELQLSGNPNNITKVTDGEVAVTVEDPNKIQFTYLSKNSLSKGKEFTVNGRCRGIEYNKKDHTIIVTYFYPGKVEILNMAGKVVKRLEKDAYGGQLLTMPNCLALSPNMTDIYVTDYAKHTVTLMTMNGNVKAVYKDNCIKGPRGLCVHKSGLVYIVGWKSHTVHQLDPISGKFKLFLEQRDGIQNPQGISYCELEDKMYIGMYDNSALKVFQMK